MTEILQANIFFFITSVAVVVFALLLCVLLYHVIKLVRSVSRIVKRIEAGSEVLAEDLTDLKRIFAEGSLVSHVLGIFLGRQKRRNSKDKSN